MNYTNFLLRVIPIGSIISIPSEYDSVADLQFHFLECAGGEVLKTDYQKLYDIIGTEYGETDGAGGVGTTHFGIPDYQGMFLRHVSGVIPVGQYDPDANKAHTHTINNEANDDWVVKAALTSIKQGNNGQNISYNGTLNYNSTYIGGNETRPSNVYVKYCIRYK